MLGRSGWLLALLLAAACGSSSPTSPTGAPGTEASVRGSTTTMLADAAPRSTSGVGASPPAQAATPVAGPYQDLTEDAQTEFGADFAGVGMVDGKPTVFTRKARGLRVFHRAAVRVVKHTLVELQAAKDKLGSVLDAAIEEGVAFHSAGIDIEANALTITLVEPRGDTSSDAFKRSRRIIEDRLGRAPVRWRAARSAPTFL